MPVEYINPSSMHQSPAFTQAIAVSGDVKTVYIGLQFAQDTDGNVAGRGDLVAQTVKALENFQACLDVAGATREQVVRLGIYVTQGQDMMAAAQAGMQWWGMTPNPPTNSVMFVAGFFPSEYLVGIEGIAVVPA